MRAPCETFSFGPFRLQPERRLLLADGLPVALSGRAYDILEFLVRNRDRIVSRDEIVAHVWKGVVVGDNNLSVQMSALRRVLATYTEKTPVIANVIGRGYQFVAAVDVPKTFVEIVASDELGSLIGQVPCSPPTMVTVTRKPAGPSATGRKLSGAVLAIVVLILVTTIGARVHHIMSVPGNPIPSLDPRLSLVVERLQADAGNQISVNLAQCYTDTLVEHLTMFEDLKVFLQGRQLPAGLKPHFRLSGKVHEQDGQIDVTIRVDALSTGHYITGRTYSTVATASSAERSALVMQVVRRIRPDLFIWEKQNRITSRHDAIDFFIDAKVASSQLDNPVQLEPALLLAEKSVMLDQTYRSAKALLSYLLTQKMLWSDAKAGTELGERGLTLIEEVFNARRNNPLYITDRVYALVALDKLDLAQATAERGLLIEPGYYKLVQALGEIFMQKGELPKARERIVPDDASTTDDRLASLAFAEKNYPEALSRTRTIIGSAPVTYETYFSMLLEVAILADSGDVSKAKDALSRLPPEMPPALKHISFLRQAYYALPDQGWLRFRKGLENAEMMP